MIPVMTALMQKRDELYERTAYVIRQAIARGVGRDDILAACYLAGIDPQDVYPKEQDECAGPAQ